MRERKLPANLQRHSGMSERQLAPLEWRKHCDVQRECWRKHRAVWQPFCLQHQREWKLHCARAFRRLPTP